VPAFSVDEKMLDDLGAKNLFDRLMEIYILPELRKRGLPENFDLRAAQIIFPPDRRPLKVRVNDEVKAIAKVRLKKGVTKQKNEQVYEHEVENLHKISLTDRDDPDCAHVTLIRIGNEWNIEFDFRFNKNLAQHHIKSAKEFYEAAQFSYQKKYWSAFIDNLFSACELAAKATLLIFPDPRYPKFRKKATHDLIRLRYTKFFDSKWVPPEHKTTFNKLSVLRGPARYLKSPFEIVDEEARELLRNVREIIENSEKRVVY